MGEQTSQSWGNHTNRNQYTLIVNQLLISHKSEMKNDQFQHFSRRLMAIRSLMIQDFLFSCHHDFHLSRTASTILVAVRTMLPSSAVTIILYLNCRSKQIFRLVNILSFSCFIVITRISSRPTYFQIISPLTN